MLLRAADKAVAGHMRPVGL